MEQHSTSQEDKHVHIPAETRNKQGFLQKHPNEQKTTHPAENSGQLWNKPRFS